MKKLRQRPRFPLRGYIVCRHVSQPSDVRHIKLYSDALGLDKYERLGEMLCSREFKHKIVDCLLVAEADIAHLFPPKGPQA